MVGKGALGKENRSCPKYKGRCSQTLTSIQKKKTQEKKKGELVQNNQQTQQNSYGEAALGVEHSRKEKDVVSLKG